MLRILLGADGETREALTEEVCKHLRRAVVALRGIAFGAPPLEADATLGQSAIRDHGSAVGALMGTDRT